MGVVLKTKPIKVERWLQMEDFESFFPMLKGMLGAIYGNPERGLKIYEERYDGNANDCFKIPFCNCYDK
jgi:hypothetical protein